MGDNLLSRTIAKLVGQPCWLVRQGCASFLTMEFGEPHLFVREPVPDSTLLQRRRVTVRGDWHLWIHTCHWRVIGGELVGDDTSVEPAIRMLDSRKLIDVVCEESRSTWEFEDEVALETRPLDDMTGEQWMLFEPDGMVLSFNERGRLVHSSAKEPTTAHPHWTDS